MSNQDQKLRLHLLMKLFAEKSKTGIIHLGHTKSVLICSFGTSNIYLHAGARQNTIQNGQVQASSRMNFQ